jgi:hypothetical protein
MDMASLNGSTFASLLCAKPAILLLSSQPSLKLPIGAVSAIGSLLDNWDLQILLCPSWAWEVGNVCRELVSEARLYSAAHPRHQLWLMCNNDEQHRLVTKNGWRSVIFNTNMFVDESTFRPLLDARAIFDAVYNARLVDVKRHQLTSLIDRLALVYFYDSHKHTPVEFHNEHARLRRLLPQAVFINRLTPDGCEWLSGRTVNSVLNTARVGLCLSAVEGQMRASIEYLVAGLPIVSTRSVGGREYFFDDDYCVVVGDDPREIRDAVAAIIARNIPRDYIRNKTMARVTRERDRFMKWVQDLIDRNAGNDRFAQSFEHMLPNGGLRPWVSVSDFARNTIDALNRAEPQSGGP